MKILHQRLQISTVQRTIHCRICCIPFCNRELLQVLTVHKCSICNARHTGRNLHGLQTTTIEQTIRNLRQPCWKLYLFKRFTILKCALTNRLHTQRKLHVHQAAATPEHITTDTCHTLRELYTQQLRTISKSIVRHRRYWIPINLTRNNNIRLVTNKLIDHNLSIGNTICKT